eukprot:1128130-Pyramimonas_sp.AAC.1
MKHRRAVYGNLLHHRFLALESALRPGLNSVCWASANVGHYLDGLEQALLTTKELLTRANNILRHRVDTHILEDIRRAGLTSLSLTTMLSPTELCSMVTEHCAARAPAIDHHSQVTII